MFLTAMLVGFFPIGVHAQESPLLDSGFWQEATLEDAVIALNQGANINVRNDGDALLHLAAGWSKAPEVVDLLLYNRGLEEIIALSFSIFTFYFLIGSLICAIAGGYIASQKNRNVWVWLIVCFLTDVIGIIVIAVIPALPVRPQGRKNRLEDEISTELFKEFPHAMIHVDLSLCYRRTWWDDVPYLRGDTSFLVVDFERKQIAVGLWETRENPHERSYRTLLAFSDVVKAEIIRDGTLVATGDSPSEYLNGAKHIAIRISVNDANKPVHEVTFYTANNKKGGKLGAREFDRAVQKVVEFHGYLDSAIQEAGEEQSERIENGQCTPASEQISKLWELKEKGALTQEEFEKQKARLLES